MIAGNFNAAGYNAECFDAVVFAGGRGSRLGGVDKAALLVGGLRLVDRAIAAARTTGAARVIVVGPGHAGELADVTVREDPPFAGPLAALAPALAEVRSPCVLLLACDLVHPGQVAEQLIAAMGTVGDGTDEASGAFEGSEAAHADGLVLCDETGHRQWLASLVSTEALRHGLETTRQAQGTLEGGSLALVFRGLALRSITALPGSTDDIDTPEHLARAQQPN